MFLHLKSAFKHLIKAQNVCYEQLQPYCFKFLYRKLTNHFARARDVWIGLNDIDNEGAFYWVDGVRSNSANTKWHRGEPNNHGPEKTVNNIVQREEEDCAQMNYHRHPLFTINDAPCTWSIPGLCEARID